jgi:hypothetical protein
MMMYCVGYFLTLFSGRPVLSISAYLPDLLQTGTLLKGYLRENLDIEKQLHLYIMN